MQDLIARVATASGLEPAIAEQAVGKILAFLQKEGPAEDVARVLAAIPGATELAEGHAGGGAGGGFMGMLGGGLMGLAGQLSGLGLGMGDMQTVGHEIFAIAREQAGEDAVGEIAAAIPGLSQFI
jgi:hypothetical protein